MNYILASASPRRKELLKLIVQNYTCTASDIDETCPETIKPFDRPEYLALQKARDIAKNHGDSIIIGADTAVFSEDKMLGKPSSKQDAFRMLSALSGKSHCVITGCALVYGKKEHCFSVKTDVKFYGLSQKEIWDYIDTGEPMDKAGAYGIQGLGCVLVEEIVGDYFNVVGLPVSRLYRELKNFEKKL